jgi:hypothetical protein
MNIFWLGVLIAGLFQFLAAVYGWSAVDIDIKFVLPYAMYGIMNIVVGVQGLLY